MKIGKILFVLFLALGFWWFLAYITTSPPGQKIPDMGREHVSETQVAQTQYNSNPPTSGPHLPIWVKAGVYTSPQSEGELIHSLEHGYVIISYNCEVHLKADSKTVRKNILPSRAFAHGLEEEASPSTELDQTPVTTGSPSAPLRTGATNESEGCKTLVRQLEGLARKKKLSKLIVVPRPQLDTTIALTAWGYIDTFDPDPIGVDAKRIERFIDFHRDHGPEKTME